MRSHTASQLRAKCLNGNENSRRTRHKIAHTAVGNWLRVLTCTNIEPQHSLNHPVKIVMLLCCYCRCFAMAFDYGKGTIRCAAACTTRKFFFGKLSNDFHTRFVCWLAARVYTDWECKHFCCMVEETILGEGWIVSDVVSNVLRCVRTALVLRAQTTTVDTAFMCMEPHTRTDTQTLRPFGNADRFCVRHRERKRTACRLAVLACGRKLFQQKLVSAVCSALFCRTRFGWMWIRHEGVPWGSLCYNSNSTPLCLLFMDSRGHLMFGIWVAIIFWMRLCGDGRISFYTHFEWGHLSGFYLPISWHSPFTKKAKSTCAYKINPADSS